MRRDHWRTAFISLAIALALTASITWLASARERRAATIAASSESGLEASIFKFDGKDFTRVQTTLMTEDGNSAMNTTLDHASPAYSALMHKRSFSGGATVFGKTYDAYYAPLTDASGKLTGALFVGIPK